MPSADVVCKENSELVFAEWHEVPPALRSVVVKLHKQYSHALSGEAVVIHSLLGGNTLLKAALLPKCETCEQEVRTLPRPVASVPRMIRSMGAWRWIPAFYHVCGMSDSLTHFIIASYLASGEQECEEGKQQKRCWIRFRCLPTKAPLDQDSTLRWSPP